MRAYTQSGKIMECSEKDLHYIEFLYRQKLVITKKINDYENQFINMGLRALIVFTFLSFIFLVGAFIFDRDGFLGPLSLLVFVASMVACAYLYANRSVTLEKKLLQDLKYQEIVQEGKIIDMSLMSHPNVLFEDQLFFSYLKALDNIYDDYQGIYSSDFINYCARSPQANITKIKNDFYRHFQAKDTIKYLEVIEILKNLPSNLNDLLLSYKKIKPNHLINDDLMKKYLSFNKKTIDFKQYI